jgi:hypothetical protein
MYSEGGGQNLYYKCDLPTFAVPRNIYFDLMPKQLIFSNHGRRATRNPITVP